MTTELLGDALAGERARPGAEARMRALHAEHSRPLLNFLMGLTNGERHAAEDLLQETMIRAWRHLDSVPEEPESCRRWLFTVARRIAIDAVRMRRARPAETSVLDLARMATSDDTTETVVAADTLRRAVRKLSHAHRTILSELYVHGRSTRETADRLGVPVGTVKSRAHYALRMLKDAFVVGA